VVKSSKRCVLHSVSVCSTKKKLFCKVSKTLCSFLPGCVRVRILGADVCVVVRLRMGG